MSALPDVRPGADVAPATSEAQALAALDAIDRVDTPEQADLLLRQITAYQAAVRLARIGRDHEHRWATVRLRAERKMGELLPPPDRGSRSVSGANTGAERVAQHQARKIAAVPEGTFTAYLETAEEPSRAGLLRSVDDELRAARAAEKRQRSAALAAVDVPPLLNTYAVLCADPPWRYEANSTPETRAIENHYPTLSLDEIKALTVPAHDDAVLFLWATSPKLAEALDVMAAWDFGYRTCMVWVKDKIGMGYYARQQHELLLIGKRGNLSVPDPVDRPSSVFNAPRGEHSAKPQVAYDLIEAMYPDLPRVELFARSPRSRWSVWGNQAEGIAA